MNDGIAQRGHGQRAFSLVEMILVVAVLTILLALFIPLALNMLEQSAISRAQADVDALATALTKFFVDMGHFPSCDAGDCDPMTNANNNLRFLAVGDGSGSLVSAYPTAASWNLTANDSGTPARNNAFNHLTVNNPGANALADQAGIDYQTGRWRGPYIATLSSDPWGRAYIIHVGAMDRNGCQVGSAGGAACTGPATGRRGWILSAGPDGNLNTSPTTTQLSGDDIGYIFLTR